MSLHSNVLSRLRDNQYLSFLINVVCIVIVFDPTGDRIHDLLYPMQAANRGGVFNYGGTKYMMGKGIVS